MKKTFLFVLGWSVAAGAAFAQGGPPTGITKTGAVTLIRAEGKVSAGPAGTIETTTDTFIAGFVSTDYTQYTPPPAPQITQIGPCVVVTITPPSSPSTPTIKVTPLDAGPVLNLNGPNGAKQFPVMKSSYGGMLGGGIALNIPGLPPPPPLYLDPGTYTVDNGAGGADVGPFTTTLNVPTALVWTNADADTMIDRSAGVDISWTGGDPGSKVTISGSSTLFDPTSFQVTGGAGFVCSVDNTGDFFVTSDVLSLLPATVAVANVPGSTLTVSTSVQTNFDASGLDTGASLFLYTSGNTRSVTFQ